MPFITMDSSVDNIINNFNKNIRKLQKLKQLFTLILD